MPRVGIAGASGYTGAELLRLCAAHPDLDVAVATGDSQAGVVIADLYPGLAAAYPGAAFAPYEPTAFDGLDLAFLCLPHGQSQEVVPDLRKRVGAIVDLGADFRLRDPSVYAQWHGEEHPHPQLLDDFVYGVPEVYREDIKATRAVAAAGCYATAAILALAPLVRSGAVEPRGIIVDAASGVSGAGRSLKPTSLFSAANEDFSAYGLLSHFHTPEIEQAIGAQVLLTPHLAPMTRGILATCYARPTAGDTPTDPLALLADAYADEPFVVVDERSPSTKATLGSNAAHLTARYDDRTGWVVVICALDNLVKGASGQMVQCANLVLGLPETAGLTAVGLYP